MGGRHAHGVGNATVDDGSFVPVTYGAVSSLARRRHKLMSNALLVGRSRSANGHPLFVAGPQVGHFYPQLLLELDLHGGGIDARGAAFPGISFYVLLGRGKDYAWSLTSSTSDLIDDYAEELCGDDTHYRYQGACREMGSFDAGTLKGAAGEPDRRLLFRTTVHGPVIGYATVDGRRVAIARKRATRGRELLSGLAWQDLNTNKPRNANEFLRSASRLEMSFNWVYADDRDIATFSSGRLPIRPDTVDPGLPTLGERRLRVARPASVRAAPAGGQPRERRARQLEQQAGARVHRRRRPVVVRFGSARRSAPERPRGSTRRTRSPRSSRR